MSRFDVGYKVGNLEVVKVEYDKPKHLYIHYCKCLVCGKIIKHSMSNMYKLKGIGCLDCYLKSHKENSVHNTRLYKVWKDMNCRCNSKNKSSSHWKNYASRGIKVCSEWKDFHNFREWALLNGWNEDSIYENSGRNKLTIDRIDNDKGYYPDNCRIANYSQQGCNRRNSQIITYNGKNYNLYDLSQLLNLPINTIKSRVKTNKSLDDKYEKHEKYNFNGEMLSLCEISKRTGIKRSTIKYRLDKGWDIYDATNIPLYHDNKRSVK